jgi:two-component system sensor histidine kinase PilS (NtrC family)
MLSTETQNQLRRLNTARVVAVTTLLLSVILIELAFDPNRSLHPLYTLTVAAYVTILAYALLDRHVGRRSWFAYLQLSGDVALVTGFVWAVGSPGLGGTSGAAESPMTFLYVLPVVAASALLYRRGGMAIAALSSVCYAGLLAADVWGGGGMGDPPFAIGHNRILYDLLSHLLGFFAVAYLGAYLAERLREADQELAEKSDDLATLRALNDHIVESINSGLITTSLSGRITFANPATAEITGREAEGLVGTDARELFLLEEDFFESTGEILRRERRFRFEKYWAREDGRRLFLGLAVSILRSRAGLPLGYLLMFQDLTEIQALEQQVRLKERMAALGEMAAGIAHELRNPLASISGSVQVLRSELDPEGEEAQLMEIVLRESQRLDRTIRDFLLFARPGSFSPRVVDLGPMLEEMATLLRNAPDFREGHEVQILAEGGPACCEVDPDRIKQVFWNLAQNAVRAMPEQGVLEVRLSPRGESQLAIRFRDQGVGMSEDEARAYFQPFSGRFRGGTGLGAAIVYRIVEEHGGQVRVHSAPERGTEVTVLLPRRLPAAEPVTRRAAGQ